MKMQKITIYFLTITMISANSTINYASVDHWDSKNDRIFQEDSNHSVIIHRNDLRGNILIDNKFRRRKNNKKVQHHDHPRVLLNIEDYRVPTMDDVSDSEDESGEIFFQDMDEYTSPGDDEQNEDNEGEVPYYDGWQCMHGVRRDFGCYDCYCVGGQIYLCSSLNCPVVRENQPLVDGNGKFVSVSYLHCIPRLWHFLEEDEDESCRNCLCIDGEQSFCYLNYCVRKFEISEPNIPFRLSGNSKTRMQPKHNSKKAWSRQSTPTVRKPKEPCVPEQFFSIGSEKACKFCVCMERGTWRCFQTIGGTMCASFLQKDKCHPGDTVKNTQSACSICYCGINGLYVCSTDENCAHQYRQIQDNTRKGCDSIVCLRRCQVQKHISPDCLKAAGLRYTCKNSEKCNYCIFPSYYPI